MAGAGEEEQGRRRERSEAGTAGRQENGEAEAQEREAQGGAEIQGSSVRRDLVGEGVNSKVAGGEGKGGREARGVSDQAQVARQKGTTPVASRPLIKEGLTCTRLALRRRCPGVDSCLAADERYVRRSSRISPGSPIASTPALAENRSSPG